MVIQSGRQTADLFPRNFPSCHESELQVFHMRDYTDILSNEILPRLRRWAAIPLRLIVGYGFMAHGYSKLAHGPAHFAAILHALGVPAPALMAWLTMAVVLLTAMFTTQLQYGFLAIKLQGVTAVGAQFGPPGYEVDLLYLACLAALVMGGSGPLAIGGLVGRRQSHPKTRVSSRAC
jgi:putative oxidoreductase